MSTLDDTDKKQIKSVNKCFRILEELQRQNGATLTDVATAIDDSPSTTFHYLSTLHSRNYVIKEDKKYYPSFRFLSLGGIARKRSDLFHNGKKEVDKLAEATEETARLIVNQAGWGITVYQSTGELVEESFGGLGYQEPLHSTAAGKAILTQLSDEKIDRVLDEHGLYQETPNTITDREELFEELNEIAISGYAIDREEHREGWQCIAAPIEADLEDVTGAVSVSAPTSRKDLSWFESDGADHLMNAAGVIKIDNTYSTWIDQ